MISSTLLFALFAAPLPTTESGEPAVTAPCAAPAPATARWSRVFLHDCDELFLTRLTEPGAVATVAAPPERQARRASGNTRTPVDPRGADEPGEDGGGSATNPIGMKWKPAPVPVTSGGGPFFEDSGGSGWGANPGDPAQELIACVGDITAGEVATKMTVYGDDAGVTYTAYSVDITTGTVTSLGSGNVGTELDITNYTSDDDSYLAIRVDTASASNDTIYGAKVTIGGEEPPATIYTTPFTTATGWSFANTQPDVFWAVDATPAGPAPDGAFQSGPSGLNYNNGTNYDDAAQVGNSGTATSDNGLIDVTGSNLPELTFWCNYDTEDTGTDFDPRFVRISNDGFSSTVADAQLATVGPTGGIDACSAPGVGHTHTLALDPAWGSIQVRFELDTIDDVANAGQGWFVDDLEVSHTPISPPPTFVRVTPDRFLVNDD